MTRNLSVSYAGKLSDAYRTVPVRGFSSKQVVELLPDYWNQSWPRLFPHIRGRGCVAHEIHERVKRYRELATNALAVAAGANPEDAVFYRRLAEQWAKLAELLERVPKD
jgi:hypothetical protein